MFLTMLCSVVHLFVFYVCFYYTLGAAVSVPCCPVTRFFVHVPACTCFMTKINNNDEINDENNYYYELSTFSKLQLNH